MKLIVVQTFVVAYLATVDYAHCGSVPDKPVAVRDCPNVQPKASLYAVFIEGCTEEPCKFTKNRSVRMEMDIDFHGPVQQLKAALYALIGVPIKWNGVREEGCLDVISTVRCPFKDGDYATYGVDLFINPSYPTITTDVKYELRDEAGDTLICWIVRASVSA